MEEQEAIIADSEAEELSSSRASSRSDLLDARRTGRSRRGEVRSGRDRQAAFAVITVRGLRPDPALPCRKWRCNYVPFTS